MDLLLAMGAYYVGFYVGRFLNLDLLNMALKGPEPACARAVKYWAK